MQSIEASAIIDRGSLAELEVLKASKRVSVTALIRLAAYISFYQLLTMIH